MISCRKFAAALLAAMCATPAFAAGPLAAFAGNFHGGGAVIGSDGHRERLSCRARGGVGEGGHALSQNIVCASDSYRFNIVANVVAQGAEASGQWSESTRGVSGSIAGRVGEGRFSGAVNGGGFTASVSLRATGRGLSMSLAPSGGDVSRVDVSLSR
ncbi:hypothetical protein M2323_002281 [Rhodoblastus acidophilus]|uniref:hypothetical protein n=1 Tax=Rhodoblastus acidophilus TaxID=1074 RepID=UPI002225B684|nr:hypothetical protein [Rhodoblastus acidophilus]MCW2284503.1 hypothetical protein [Rhodoblastus acidophilus]MCW2333350.1 hypothetical protein [Rhodoblastus acidophilus]